MEKVKVLQMPLRNNRGGIAKYILENWRFINRDKFVFDFITFEKQIDFKGELLAEGCKIHYVSCLPSQDKERFYTEIHAILDEGYDAIHLHTSRWTGTQLEEIAMEHGVSNVIVHSHSTDISVSPQQTERFNFFSERHENIKREFSSNWKSYATNLCACSDMAARWLFGDKLADSEVIVLKNAIDVTRFVYNEAVRERYRRELDLDDCFVIGHVGRFNPIKNHKFIIRIFSETAKIIPSARLLLVGGGRSFDEINTLAQEYGIGNKTRFLGLRRDVTEIMQAMDAFVLPSLFEGLGIVAVEAQTSGLPVFLSDRVPREVDITGECSFSPLNSGIWVKDLKKTYFDDKNNRVELGMKVKGSRFDIDTQVGQLCNYYKELLKND